MRSISAAAGSGASGVTDSTRCGGSGGAASGAGAVSCSARPSSRPKKERFGSVTVSSTAGSVSGAGFNASGAMDGASAAGSGASVSRAGAGRAWASGVTNSAGWGGSGDAASGAGALSLSARPSRRSKKERFGLASMGSVSANMHLMARPLPPIWRSAGRYKAGMRQNKDAMAQGALCELAGVYFGTISVHVPAPRNHVRPVSASIR